MKLFKAVKTNINLAVLVGMNLGFAIGFFVSGDFLFGGVNLIASCCLYFIVLNGMKVITRAQKDHERIMNDYIKALQFQQKRDEAIKAKFNEFNDIAGGSQAK